MEEIQGVGERLWLIDSIGYEILHNVLPTRKNVEAHGVRWEAEPNN